MPNILHWTLSKGLGGGSGRARTPISATSIVGTGKTRVFFRLYKHRLIEHVICHITPFKDGVDDFDKYWENYFGIKMYLFPRRFLGQHLLPPDGFCSEVRTRRSVVYRQHKIFPE